MHPEMYGVSIQLAVQHIYSNSQLCQHHI